jgi:hypothetical protein
MLKRIFASILVAAAFLFALVKWVLSLASMASTLEFLKNHFSSVIRVRKQTTWLLTRTKQTPSCVW